MSWYSERYVQNKKKILIALPYIISSSITPISWWNSCHNQFLRDYVRSTPVSLCYCYMSHTWSVVNIGLKRSYIRKHMLPYKTISYGLFNHFSTGEHFKNTYELLNLRALKFSHVNKIHIFQCMGKIFCAEFQRCPLKFHTKYLTHTLKDMIFIQHRNFKSS